MCEDASQIENINLLKTCEVGNNTFIGHKIHI